MFTNCVINRNGECSLSIVEIVDGQCGNYSEKEKDDLDVYKRCDDNILESAEKDGFPRDEITRNLDGIDQLTKSPRIMRLIRMAYWRGCRRGVDMVRQANMLIYPAENSKK